MFNRRKHHKRRKHRADVKRPSSPRLFDQPRADEPRRCPDVNVQQTVNVVINDDDALDKCCGCLAGLFKLGAKGAA